MANPKPHTDINEKGNPDFPRDSKGRFTKGGGVGRPTGAKNVLTKDVKEIIKKKGVPFLNRLFEVAMDDLKKTKGKNPTATNAVKLCAAFLLKQMPTLKAVLLDDLSDKKSIFRKWATWTQEQRNEWIISGGTVLPPDADPADFEILLNAPLDDAELPLDMVSNEESPENGGQDYENKDQ